MTSSRALISLINSCPKRNRERLEKKRGEIEDASLPELRAMTLILPPNFKYQAIGQHHKQGPGPGAELQCASPLVGRPLSVTRQPPLVFPRLVPLFLDFNDLIRVPSCILISELQARSFSSLAK